MHEEKMTTLHINGLVKVHTKELHELRMESEDLCPAAVQPDATQLPFKANMIMATTVLIRGHIQEIGVVEEDDFIVSLIN